MSNIPNLKPLSEAISLPIQKSYKTGGYGLAFITIATILLLVAFFGNKGILSYILVSVSILMIVFVLVFFYLKEFKVLKRFYSNIKQNKEIIDTVQNSAIELTKLTFILQSLAFKHADHLASIINYIRPTLKSLSTFPAISKVPIVSKLVAYADSEIILKSEKLSKAIVDNTKKAQKVISDIQIALINSDASVLNKYIEEIELLKNSIEGQLAR